MSTPLTLQSGNLGTYYYVPEQGNFATGVVNGDVSTLGPFTVEQMVPSSVFEISMNFSISVNQPLVSISNSVRVDVFRNVENPVEVFSDSYYFNEGAVVNQITLRFVDEDPTEGLSILGKPIEYTVVLNAVDFTGGLEAAYTLNALTFEEKIYPVELSFQVVNTP